MSDARGEWPRLAGRAAQVRLELPGAVLRTEVRSLVEEEGRSAWREERVWRGEDGAWLFARLSRIEGQPERLLLVPAAGPEALVAALRARVGMTPGLVEVLGRAGIEIGLEPDDQPED